METESLSDADRTTANAAALGTVESEIVSLEQMFAALESLKTEKDRLSAAVRTLTEEETRTLQDDGGSESAVVKKLIEIRTRRDVQSARLTSTQDKIKAQTTGLADQGESVRRAFQFVVGRLYVARETRVTATLTELFGNHWIILRDGKRLEMKHLAKHTQLMKQVRDLDITVSHPIGDPAQEEIALRQRPRLWLTELTDFVNREPGLFIRSVPAKQQQPIEQPAREMATV
jgi:hypothetical protein